MILLYIAANWKWLLGALASAALGIALTVTAIDRNQWRAAARAAQVALEKVKAAQPIAEAAQAAVNHAPAAKSQTIAETSNANAKSDYDEGRAAGVAYADAHRVRPDAQCKPGNPYLPGTDHVAAVDDEAGKAAGMVAVSQDDFDILTGNSTRLAKVQADASALIAAGVAVESK
ncbi:hypothetical protein [Bacillus thuringiensis]|uniref:hypothetical protein n=1 Tax=Bacillus thuringiensis TaxID=1428 RepID=UPI002175EAFA|nr:hypothetical protein [Bacillus thuringiensis]